ncbi:Phosphate-induced protein 1 [Macleaya cordata]|uniref:Phosphate-induced protein 1 n=1 Tax=Macleaya cordata TaxID=56857 RepID=A0A200QBZ4_MACCD|nr:Phosphate-induced protein 1 [Macleaya cordata]
MASSSSFSSSTLLLQVHLVVSLFRFSLAAGRRLTELVQDQPALPLQYHKGPLLTGKISINLIWYGNFMPSQRAIVSDFFNSLYSSSKSQNQPSVSTWWKTTEKYYHLTSSKKSLVLTMGKQILDENYSLGKSLTSKQIVRLASRGEQRNAINVVLTASDVAVEGFCSSR